MKPFITSPAQFAIFRREAQRLAKLWAISGWRIDYSHERLGSRAECRIKGRDRVAVIALSTEWEIRDGNGDEHYGPTRERQVNAARHEMVHLLIADYAWLATRRCVGEDELNAAEEALCRRLHHLLP